jgi:hypothetical protein
VHIERQLSKGIESIDLSGGKSMHRTADSRYFLHGISPYAFLMNSKYNLSLNQVRRLRKRVAGKKHKNILTERFAL